MFPLDVFPDFIDTQTFSTSAKNKKVDIFQNTFVSTEVLQLDSVTVKTSRLKCKFPTESPKDLVAVGSLCWQKRLRMQQQQKHKSDKYAILCTITSKMINCG